jgi:nucleoside-diphosphate-sugar epimerase
MKNLAGKRVFVTGASGFIGSHLVQALVDLGCIVSAVAHRVAPKTSDGQCTWLSLDLLCAEETMQALAATQPEILFHLAAHPDATECHAQALASVQANACMTLNLLEGCRAAKTQTFIYGDSSKVYGNGGVPYCSSQTPQPLCSYAIGKLAGWELCLLYHRLYEMDVVSVRPTLVYGPGQKRNLISSILAQLQAGERSIELLGGTQTRDPLYVEDAVRAFAMAAERSSLVTGEVINVGGGQEQTVYALAQQVVDAFGAQARVEVKPSGIRPNDTLRSFCDNREARELLGWSPTTPFAAGLEFTLKAQDRTRGLQACSLEA